MITLTKDDGNRMVYDEHPDFEDVPGTEKIVDQGRWDTMFKKVFKHVPSGKFYMLHYSLGSTEQQECDPFEYSDPEPEEVELREVTKKEWMKVAK